MNQADPGVRDHAPPGTERLLAGLTPEQAQAVTFGAGPLQVLAEISRAKNQLLSPESYEQSARNPGAPLIAAVWRESERELQRCNALCFDDLLAFAVRLLSEHPHRLAWLRQRWRWLLADEFQDTSHAQAMLVDLIAGPDGHLCVCGDDE